MDYNSIFNLFIGNYGYLGLFLSFSIIVLFILMPYLINKSNKNINKSLNELTINMSNSLTNALTDSNKALIENITINESELIKNQMTMIESIIAHNTQMHSVALDIRDSISIPIQDKINHLRDYYNTSRVGIIEFHNSLVNLNGLPFKWYDLIYESIARGVHAMTAETKNLPINILSPIIYKVINGDIVTFKRKDIEKFYDQSSVLYDFTINKMNINTLVVAPLLNNEYKLVGILTLEYNNENKPTNTIQNLSEFEKEAHAISTLLALKASTEQKINK